MRPWYSHPFAVRTRHLMAALALLAACGGGMTEAQGIKTPGDSRAALHDVSQAEFAQDIARLQGMVGACRSAASGCGATIDRDDRIKGGAEEYVVRWDWLRDALNDASSAKPEVRASLMDDAAGHLQELSHELAPAAAGGAVDFAEARKKSSEILERNEFLNAPGPTWWQRQQARIQMWLYQAYDALTRMGKGAPWMGTLLEWLVFLGAGVGVLLLVRRAFARQRLQIAMSSGAAQWNAFARESADWAADAERHAANAEWREAVHCLYWAAIVKLEARRMWRHNPARTPREYVRLMKPGSPQQGALRKLTAIFERVWYGLRDAQAADYERARTLFDGLSAGVAAEPQA